MRWHYFVHLTAWTLPVLAGQWAIGRRIFRKNLRAILAPAVIFTIYFSAADQVAVHAGLWLFDPSQILGWRVGGLPMEEILFFLLTSLLVTQSFVLLLPRGLRDD